MAIRRKKRISEPEERKLDIPEISIDDIK